MLEEATVFRRISSGGCSAQLGGGSGQGGGPLPHHKGALSPRKPLDVSSLAGKAFCWLNLNVEPLREQFLALQSQRRKLGEGACGWGKPGTVDSLQSGTGSTGSPRVPAPWREDGCATGWGL